MAKPESVTITGITYIHRPDTVEGRLPHLGPVEKDLTARLLDFIDQQPDPDVVPGSLAFVRVIKRILARGYDIELRPVNRTRDFYVVVLI